MSNVKKKLKEFIIIISVYYCYNELNLSSVYLYYYYYKNA
jgi:hypothetical protein